MWHKLLKYSEFYLPAQGGGSGMEVLKAVEHVGLSKGKDYHPVNTTKNLSDMGTEATWNRKCQPLKIQLLTLASIFLCKFK